MKVGLICAIFVVSYALLTKSHVPRLPLGRTGAAFVGAVCMVAIGALSPEQAGEALDLRTLLLLFAMMGLGAFFEDAQLFAGVERLLASPRLSPRALLQALVWLSGVLSAFLINDTVCVFLTPIVCAVCVRRKLPLAPYLLAIATSANIGSAGTLVGNPQNMLIGTLGPLSFARFALAVGPAALLCLGINGLLLQLSFAKTLAGVGAHEVALAPAPPPTKRGLLVLTLVVLGFFAFDDLVLTSLGALAIALVLARRTPDFVWRGVDWPLLVFFGGLFVLVAGFRSTGFPAQAFGWLAPAFQLHTAQGVGLFTLFTLIGSNLFSNVPLVALTGPWLRAMPDAALGFALLGFVSTVAGNLTLLGSVANLIVAERARGHYELGFWEYARYGVYSTLVVLALGVPCVYLCCAVFL